MPQILINKDHNSKIGGKMEPEKSQFEDPEFKNYREDIKQAKADRLEIFKIFSTF